MGVALLRNGQWMLGAAASSRRKGASFYTHALCSLHLFMMEIATLMYKSVKGATALALAILEDYTGRTGSWSRWWRPLFREMAMAMADFPL
ncbi:hypothetical protein BP00DRAFT_212658 [Aspergillus indologenus CBS 114.80]|uniref:Uncharacterized protein n=1 Tax=Aspergillus indologenus CBS 114.80 TaxID=1450541 RepID=A0A2V5I7K8_9EURO|nr:hypothetical protein BP00DRAFT_212658 [Aspergillus indologenus CBS 114.80]